MEKLSIFDEFSYKPIGHGERYLESTEELTPGKPTGDEITYLHVIFAQTGFPYKDVVKGQPFQRRNGQAVIGLTPGYLLDPLTGNLELQGLPYGTIVRRLMLYICNEALRTNSREIDMNRSMGAFIREDMGMGKPTGGDTGNITRLKEMMNRTAATTVTIGLNYLTEKGGRGAATFKPEPAISGYNIWEEKSLIGREKFNTIVLLSEPFFEGVQAHSIPLDDRAILALRHSPLYLDTYFNLAQRLHRIAPGKPQKVSAKDLHSQMGQEYSRTIDFMRKYKAAVDAVRKVYPGMNVVVNPQGAEFHHSKTPVSRKQVQALLFPETPNFDPQVRRNGPDPNVGVWKRGRL
jgi:hypothetical protein